MNNIGEKISVKAFPPLAWFVVALALFVMVNRTVSGAAGLMVVSLAIQVVGIIYQSAKQRCPKCDGEMKRIPDQTLIFNPQGGRQ